jgi:hypothetical protein
VAGASTEAMDTSPPKDDSDHILISENGFSPNPKFLERSEESELEHLQTYSDDHF